MSAICHAVGVLQASDSQQLHDRPMNIKVGIQPARDGYEASNSIKGYEAYGQETQAPQVSNPVPAQPAQAASTPPWKKSLVDYIGAFSPFLNYRNKYGKHRAIFAG
ncbi:hypothetical protein THIOSC15_1140001 [uncultured Thiomicrorhabdus sp.]